KHFPQLVVLVRAFDWEDAHRLIKAGVTYVYRESLDTSLRMGTDALRMLGFRSYQIQRAGRTFLRHDAETLHELTARRDDRARYLDVARRRIAELERILLTDREDRGLDRDLGWDAQSLREEVQQRPP
ncbi:MAG: hypothetical protein MI924_18440, partial [Chloroflexales bacterium]|nr:hypothetical protein [Chloroflexales bacterium]